MVKFSGNRCEYFRFKSHFEEIVDTKNISEAQKMSRLLQFLYGPGRSAVAGFEGVPGGLGKALKCCSNVLDNRILWQRHVLML